MHWEIHAQGMLGRLRAAVGRHPDDPRLTRLTADLHEHSPQVRAWWPRHDVRPTTAGTKTLRHPTLGLIILDHSVFDIPDAPGQQLTVYTAAPGTPESTALSRLLSEPESP